MRRGAYPGTFDPPTVAHLAIAEAARDQRRLDRVDLVLSRVSLAKEDVGRLDQRAARLRDLVADRSWLGVVVTDAQLLADIAQGYDVLILGADKWHQIQDVGFYGSIEARDAALARLPELAVAPRRGFRCPPRTRIVLPRRLAEVSSSAVRAGADHWRA